MKKEYANGRLSNTVKAFEVLCGLNEVQGTEDYRFKAYTEDGEETIDFDKLRVYIIFDYLPKNVKVNKIGKAKNLESVTFNSLLKLNLSQTELYDVLMILDKLDVYVTGYCSDLNSAMDYTVDEINECIDIHVGDMFRTFPKYDPSFDNIGKIREYQNETNPDKKIELRNQIVENNCRLVPYVMYKNFKYIPEPDKYDVCQEGLIYLTKAIDNFDTYSGYQFSSYAYVCIKGGVLRGVYNIYKSTPAKASGQYNCNLLRDIYAIIDQDNLDESYMFTQLMVDKLYSFYSRTKKYISREKISKDLNELYALKCSIGTEEVYELEESGDLNLEYYPHTDGEDIEAEVIRNMLGEQLEKLLTETCSERYQEVIKLRFGIDDGIPRTLEEVGKKMGVTRDRVRQIEAKAIRRMYSKREKHRLEDLY